MADIEKLTYYGKVKTVNSSDGIYNMIVQTKEKDINVKSETALTIGALYELNIARHSNSDRDVYYLVEYKKVSEMEDLQTVDKVFRMFDDKCPLSLNELKDEIYKYLNLIDNKVIKDIVSEALNRHYKDFFSYPAGIRLHHAHFAGLAYHTVEMLHMTKGFLDNWKFLDKDYLYGGIILHDMGKIKEFTSFENPNYAVEGQLLGHLVMESLDIDNIARDLNYQDKEEVLLLEHMVISHHGQPVFGACKKPQTPEALILWYIDSIDSKLRVLEDELENTNSGEFTEPIGVLDKVKFYKKN